MKAALGFAVLAGASVAATSSLALPWTLGALALSALAVNVASPAAIRERFVPMVVLLLVLSVLAWAPAAARALE